MYKRCRRLPFVNEDDTEIRSGSNRKKRYRKILILNACNDNMLSICGCLFDRDARFSELGFDMCKKLALKFPLGASFDFGADTEGHGAAAKFF